MSANLQKLVTLVRTRRLRLVVRVLARWLWGDRLSYGLRRACEPPLRLPPPAIPLDVRRREPGDERAFTELSAALADDAVLVRINAAHLLLSGVETCFVAVTDAGTPCGMQYLIDSSRNDELDEVFGGLVPRLGSDEALLEFAFTLEPYRAKGVMPHLLSTLGGVARDRGLARLLTFVPADNGPQLRFYVRLGFEPFLLRRERYRLFRRRVTFEPLPPGAPVRELSAARRASSPGRR